ncbi:MAG TPA: bi-domain-containing oxidoreductase [Blastocatellia bacterium]|nr:bi-domain-containing oxidoreductase [Blastocatellia bacterium]
MKQVVQNYRTGELTLEQVPEPALKPGGVLVRNACSLISAGTERTIVETAQSSMLGKARGRPDLVRQVFDTFKREGFRATYEKVTARLNQIKPLGYSASGVIAGVGRHAEEFRIGDRVASAGGGYAVHAELNYIPRNLCVKIPDAVSFETACYTTVGAIALHGVRQAEPRIGETVAVIGLGLVGQLTVQLLKSSGCAVLGVDIDASACELARNSGADQVASERAAAIDAVNALSEGRGADRVIITAATKSSDPLVLAAELARDRATIVVVGLIGMDVPRHLFYQKELELKLSRSYGPGRYDVDYEEKGQDYPIGYVRWTERRNMEAFLRLASEGKINTDLLTTHVFEIDRARDAYDLVLNRSERYCGIVLRYPEAGSESTTLRPVPRRAVESDELAISFIGAGNFARGVLLPALKRESKIRLLGVSAATGISAKNAQSQFGFEFAATGFEEILADERTRVVFVATQHDIHASVAAEALRRGKHVFVEKPLAINEQGLRTVVKAARDSGMILMTGFNRRFAPVAVEMRKRLEEMNAPMTISYRVNAGRLPADHWTLDPDIGGGRIIGEVCHFIDFVQFITGAVPVRVDAELTRRVVSAAGVDDSAIVSLGMSDGSVATIVYAAAGDGSVPKERIEVFCGGAYGLIDDFKEARFVRERKILQLGGGSQDKGHAREINAFLKSVRENRDSPITLESMFATTLASIIAAHGSSASLSSEF